MESWCFTISFAKYTGSEVPQRWLLLNQASKERRHLSTFRTTGTRVGSFAIPYCIEKKSKPKTLPMRSDAVIFVEFVAQLLKSLGGYFFWSAGPWDCEACAIARSSKAAYFLLEDSPNICLIFSTTTPFCNACIVSTKDAPMMPHSWSAKAMFSKALSSLCWDQCFLLSSSLLLAITSTSEPTKYVQWTSHLFRLSYFTSQH